MSNPNDYIAHIRADIEESSRTRLGRDSVNLLNTVSESIFSRSAHFILELLQNAEDAGPKNVVPNGEIEFAIAKDRIRVTHNGIPFSEANVDAICGVRSTKKPEQGTLGFLGIGFKSVFKITDCPEVYSGDFAFKFDRHAHAHADSVPWQIMPIALATPSERVDQLFTTFVLPFRSAEIYEQVRDELSKLDVHVFLFLRWLRRLKVIDVPSGQSVLIENLGEEDGILAVRKNDHRQRFVISRRSVDVPDEIATDPVLVAYKRQNVKRREVVVAFALDDNGNLQSIEDASALGSVSSFLPLVEERSGAKFLIQGDFLVQPGREALQYQLAWNRWLVDEAVKAVADAIGRFKVDPKWSRQFLPIFNFTLYNGQPAFDELFQPHLVVPLLEYLKRVDVVRTESNGFIRPELAVFVESGLEGLLTDADLPLLFPNSSGMRLADKALDLESLPKTLQEAAKVVRFEAVARTAQLLNGKLGQDAWFRSLYEGMSQTGRQFKHTLYQTGRNRRFQWYDTPIFVLTENNTVVSAKDVHLRTIPPDVSELRAKHPDVDAVLRTYTLLHACLDTPELNTFFKEQTHVTEVDFQKICSDVFLKKLRIGALIPPRPELMAYTRLLQKGPRITEPIWTLTQRGDIKPSNELFFGAAYSPAENWEKNSQYVPQMDFVSDDYLQGVTAADKAGWKAFFTGASVKENGQSNHVEAFAMTLVERVLADELDGFVAKNRQQVGYDREARRKRDGAVVKIEIKGIKKDAPIQLVGNEPTAVQTAASNGLPFWVCVVTQIPEAPQLWVVENATTIGKHDTLTLDVTQWRTHGRRVL